MYLGVDCGGTKTLLAVFSAEGQKLEERRFPTDKNYQQFLNDFKKELNQLENGGFEACCCAVPGKVDRTSGTGIKFGNLPWQNVPLRQDVEALLSINKVWIENDAKMAGLYEYKKSGQYKSLLYIGIGTGVAISLIVNGEIDQTVDDLGGNIYKFKVAGQDQTWDNAVSGRAIVKKYGKKAKDIDEPAVWQEYSRDLASGLSELIIKWQPEAVVIGGGVGSHFHKFEPFLINELKQKLGTAPAVVEAQNPEEAVIYGCFEFLKEGLKNG